MSAFRICLTHLTQGVGMHQGFSASALRRLSSSTVLSQCRAVIAVSRHDRNIFRSYTKPHYLQNQKILLRSLQCSLAFISPDQSRYYGVLGGKGNDPVKTEDNTEENQQNDNEKEPPKDKWYSGKNAWKVGLVCLSLSAFSMVGNMLYAWGPPELDKEGNEIVDEFTSLPTWQAYFRRTLNEANLFKKMIEQPTAERLLPDTLREPYHQPPYTLVMEMKDILVHPDWTLNTGWRFKKRPGLDYLLQHAGPPLFEIVIYTKEQGMTAFPIITSLDPQGFISYRLFKDSTLYTKGHHVKKLDNLNRDLSKVIFIECDPQATSHTRNTFMLRPWNGNDDDRTLVTLANFLRTVGTSGVDDVRTVLDYYNQSDEPLELFLDNQRKLEEQQIAFAQQRSQEKEKKNIAGSWAINPFGRRK